MYFRTYIICLLLLYGVKPVFADNYDYLHGSKDSLQITVEQWCAETMIINTYYTNLLTVVQEELKKTNDSLRSTSNQAVQLKFLIKKDSIKDVLKSIQLHAISDISKVRYIKGLEIIKLLYNKTVALDHHFSSVSTLNEISKMSNPNYYHAFSETKKAIETNRDKRSGFDLTQILGDNIYTSITHSLISLFTNTSTAKAEKEESLKEIECIMDFTLRMSNDLDTIYFETVFLQKSNETIMEQLDQLFVDFTKPIKYNKPLKECRSTDDWDNVRAYLNAYIKAMDEAIANSDNLVVANKMQINLEFPIDQLLQFIIQYNAFIDQGSKFYEKFAIMLDSYENEEQCADQIPTEYLSLKKGVNVAIEKFQTAYKPVEINGSKLKQLLYGISEYE